MGVETIPAGIEDITASWLTEAMTPVLEGATVTTFEPTLIAAGVGIASSVYRLALELDDPDAGPSSVVVKLPALDEAAHFTSVAIRMYHREVSFFAELAPSCPFRVPQCYHGASEPDAGETVIVMEDLGGLRGGRSTPGDRPSRTP